MAFYWIVELAITCTIPVRYLSNEPRNNVKRNCEIFWVRIFIQRPGAKLVVTKRSQKTLRCRCYAVEGDFFRRLSIWRLLVAKIATIGLLVHVNQLLVIERVLERFQCVGVDEIILLWLLRIVTSGLRMGIDVVRLGVFHWWTLRVILCYHHFDSKWDEK